MKRVIAFFVFFFSSITLTESFGSWAKKYARNEAEHYVGDKIGEAGLGYIAGIAPVPAARLIYAADKVGTFSYNQYKSHLRRYDNNMGSNYGQYVPGGHWGNGQSIPGSEWTTDGYNPQVKPYQRI